MKRREFFKWSASMFAGSILSKDLLQNAGNLVDSVYNRQLEFPQAPVKAPESEIIPVDPRIFAPSLKKGDTIAITAPASPTSPWEIRNSVRLFRTWGFKVETGDTIARRKQKARYLSAPDDLRLNEFMEYVERDDVKCILCGRGGYGTMRILDRLDYDKIKANPKVIIGYSDITALVNAIYTKTGLVAFHGPVAASEFDSFTKSHLKDVLLHRDKFEPITRKYSKIKTINPGKARGKIIGGNLSLLVATLGTEYEIDTKGAILFIEEVSEHPYKIDRMLTQLKLAGKFEDAEAIVIGNFKGLNNRRPYFPGGSFTIKEVLDQIIKPLEKVSVLGMPFGHIKSKLTLPIGVEAELDTEAKSLTILEPSVSYI